MKSYTSWGVVLFVFSILAAQTAYAADIWEIITPSGTTGYSYTSILSMDDYVYLGTDHGVYRSANRGTTWSEVNVGLTNNTVHTLVLGVVYDGSAYVIDAQTPVFVGTSDGLFKSTIGNTTWSPANSGLTDTNVFDIEFDQFLATQGVASTLYAATPSGVFRSDDAGATWTDASLGLEGKGVLKLMTDYGTGNIFALTDTNEVYVSPLNSVSAAGESWTSIFTGGVNSIRDISLLKALSTISWLGTDDGIMKSDTNGMDWVLTNSGNISGQINVVMSDYLDTNITYAGSETGGMYRTVNEALGSPAWEPINPNLTDPVIVDIATNPASSLIVYAVGTSGVYRLSLSDSYADIAAPFVGVTPPSVPTGLQGTPISSTRIDLSWSPNSAPIASYEVTRNGSSIALVSHPTTSFSDVGLTPSTAYTYAIRAVTANNIQSSFSGSITVSTNAAPASSGGGGGGGGSSSVRKGCTDPKATNYDKRAKRDDKSCIYAVVTPATQPVQVVANNTITNTPVPTIAPSPQFVSPLALGSRGEEVMLLQKFLVSRGYMTDTPTGYFGYKTEEAVKKYQRANGLDPVGYIGPLTRVRLNADQGTNLGAPMQFTDASQNGAILARIAELLKLIEALRVQLALINASSR